MIKFWIPFIIIFSIFLPVISCNYNKIHVELNKEVSLCPDQQVSVKGEDLIIKFKKVTADSRCPKNVNCVWAGQVTSIIEVKSKGITDELILNEPGLTDGYAKEIYGNYEFVFHISPYPEAGKKISQNDYRLNLIVNKLPKLTEVLGSINVNPASFNGKEVVVIGYFRGWDLLQEVDKAPPITRSDWVVKDNTGAIYINANSPAKLTEGLRHNSLEDTNTILKVEGIIYVTEQGQPYIEATKIQLLHKGQPE